MLQATQEEQRKHIAEWIKGHGGGRSSLMPVLREIQKRYAHVSEYAMQVVADGIGIHPSEIYGVVTFYSFLSDKPKGRYVIRLCGTISCDLAGKDRVARQLENDLGIKFGETTADGKFSLEWTNCVGMCDQGPAMLVNDRVFTKVTPEMVHDILEECRKTFGAYASHSNEEE